MSDRTVIRYAVAGNFDCGLPAAGRKYRPRTWFVVELHAPIMKCDQSAAGAVLPSASAAARPEQSPAPAGHLHSDRA